MNLINECTAWVVTTVGSVSKSFLRVIAAIDPDTLSELFASDFKGTPISVNSGVKTGHTFTNGTRKFLIRSEKVTEILYNFDENDFDANILLTITSGGHLKEDLLYLENKTIYFKTDKNTIVEISEWY